jgi:hypothetical protein
MANDAGLFRLPCGRPAGMVCGLWAQDFRPRVIEHAAAAQQPNRMRPHEPSLASPTALVECPATLGFLVGAVVGIPRWHAGVRGAPRGASNLPATLPRIASRRTCWLWKPSVSTCGFLMRRLATPGSRCGGRSLHTAEVTGSIPVTPTNHQRRSAPHTSGRRRPPERRQAANRRRAHSGRPGPGRGCRPGHGCSGSGSCWPAHGPSRPGPRSPVRRRR